MWIIILLFVTITLTGTSIADLDTLWIRDFGTVDDESGYSLEQTLDGGFVLGGLSSPFMGNPEFYMIKTDSDGMLDWESFYPGSAVVSSPAAIQLVDSTYVIAGGDGDMPYNLIHVIKADKLGNLEWEDYYCSMHTYTTSTCITSMPAELNFVIGGSSFDSPGSQMYALKLTSLGGVNWDCYVGEAVPGYSMYGNSIEQTSFGFVMAGRSPQNPGGGVITTISPSGTVLMDTTIGRGYNSFNCAREVSDGNLVAAGYDTDLSECFCYMVKFTTDGETLWEKVCETDYYSERVKSFVQTQDGGFMIVGTSTNLQSNDLQVLLMKVDSQGEVENVCRLGNDQRVESGVGIVEISQDIFVVMATVENVSGNDDIYLMQLNTVEMGLTPGTEPADGEMLLECIPNPCCGRAEISLLPGNSVTAEISVFDCSGRIVRHLGTLEPGTEQLSWNSADDRGNPLPQGVYTVMARSGREIASRRLVIIR